MRKDLNGPVLSDDEDTEMGIKLASLAKNKASKGKYYFNLGKKYYNLNSRDILYSKLYFELALKYGYSDAAYYLATIYQYVEDIDIMEHDISDIIELYEYATTYANDSKIRALALMRLLVLDSQNQMSL